MQACCFDMDGVIVDSEDAWAGRERNLLPRVVPDADVALAEITGMNYRDIYDYLAETYEVAVTKAEFVAWYDEVATEIYGSDVSLLPGARDLVADLRERGVRVAVVSSSPLDWIDVVLDRFDLAFDAVVSGDAVEGPGKPDPALYEHAAARLGVQTGAVVAVEDSVHGIDAARRAGTTVVGFRFGDAAGTDFADADYAPSDRETLFGLLRDLLAGD
ncbi:MAG: HAD family phosphatase [Haloarculaceae archaeon]